MSTGGMSDPPPRDGGFCMFCGAPLARPDVCEECGHAVKDPRVGLVLDGKYRVDAFIGAGGMGRVYRATHLQLGEPLAIKFLLARWTSANEIRVRFRREAVALARLRHPNLVTVLDFGEHAGELFMVMELVRGETLSATMKDGPLSRLRIGPIFDQILQLLEAAHAQGITHRDLKPENVMLVASSEQLDRVKVLDFGLVHFDEAPGAERLTETGHVQGTPMYMSPEQCRGLRVGPATDIYAVGVMLYEAITGVPPFDSHDVAELMALHMFLDVPPMIERGVERAVPRGLEALTRAALSKRAEDRPTAQELRAELAAVTRGTDAFSMADRAMVERERMAGLPRDERGITGRHHPKGSEEASAELPRRARGVIWASPGPRAESLQTALAVMGIQSKIWSGAKPPPHEHAGERVEVLLIQGSADGLARTALAKATPEYRAVPVLTFDVLDAPSMAALIRAGASDVALSAVSDDDVCRKVRRLLKK